MIQTPRQALARGMATLVKLELFFSFFFSFVAYLTDAPAAEDEDYRHAQPLGPHQ